MAGLVLGEMGGDSPGIKIRLAELSDVDQIASAYENLLSHEAAYGTRTNWKAGIYPTAAIPLAKIPAKSMHVLEENGEICASMILDSEQAPEYGLINWLYPAQPEHVLVIHTLCIPPEKSGRGFATRMVDYALAFGRRQGLKVARIDTWIHNEPAKRLYAKFGFRISGRMKARHMGLFDTELVYLELNL